MFLESQRSSKNPRDITWLTPKYRLHEREQMREVLKHLFHRIIKNKYRKIKNRSSITRLNFFGWKPRLNHLIQQWKDWLTIYDEDDDLIFQNLSLFKCRIACWDLVTLRRHVMYKESKKYSTWGMWFTDRQIKMRLADCSLSVSFVLTARFL